MTRAITLVGKVDKYSRKSGMLSEKGEYHDRGKRDADKESGIEGET